MLWVILVFISCGSSFNLVSPFTILKVSPSIGLTHDHVDLRCHYELDNALYSIKFYRDGQEIYRYIPRDTVPVRVFSRKGIHLQKTLHFHNWIRLLDVNKDTEGVYKCEVSTEGPMFETYSDEARLVVLDQPKDPPMLTYRDVNGVVEYKCRSPDPLLKGRFHWTVNGGVLRQQEEPQEETVSVMDYVIHPWNSWTTVQCRLFLGSVYNMSSEVVLFQDKAEKITSRGCRRGVLDVMLVLVVMGSCFI